MFSSIMQISNDWCQTPVAKSAIKIEKCQLHVIATTMAMVAVVVTMEMMMIMKDLHKLNSANTNIT